MDDEKKEEDTMLHKVILKIMVDTSNGHQQPYWNSATYVPVYHSGLIRDYKETEWIEHIIILKFNDIENTHQLFHSFNFTKTWILLHYSIRSNLTYYVSKSGGGVNVVVQ